MHTSSHSFAAILLFAALASSASAQGSLCSKGELVAFSCAVGDKLVSLCASADLSKTAGYVQYRYGKKDKVDFVFPESRAHPRAYFRWGVNGYAGGGTDYFRFSNKGYDYVVYSGMGKGWEREGIVVEKNGKRLSSQVCKNAALGPDNWAVMYSANLPHIEGGGNEFDMP